MNRSAAARLSSLLCAQLIVVAAAVVVPAAAAAQEAPVRELPPPAPLPLPSAAKPAAAAPGAVSTPVRPAAPAAQQNNVHGIGVAGSFTTGSGLTYRRYFGNTSVQATVLAIITDRGDDAVAFVGASAVQYLLVWHSPGSRGLLPSTTALRVVGGAHYYLKRWIEDTGTFSNNIFVPKLERKSDSSVNLGVGLGFEFGGIVRSGFSLSTDLVLTAAIDEKGLDYILPLPQAALVYSW